MNEKIIKPARKSIFKTISIFSIVMLIVLYAAFSSRFAWIYGSKENFNSYLTQDLIVIAVWAGITILSTYVMLKLNFYTITNSEIIHHKLGKEVSYSFANILYIDEEYTKKHKTLLFYLNNGKSIFLVLDKEGEILKAINKNCHNLMTRQAFHEKFPRIKL